MKNIKKSLMKITLFGFLILLVFSVFAYGQVSVSGRSSQVSGVIRDLWDKVGNAIFPANLGWNIGIGTSTPQAKLDVNGTAYVTDGIRLKTSLQKPTCDLQTAGTLWYETAPAGTSGGDRLFLCHATLGGLVNQKSASFSMRMDRTSCAEDSATNLIYCFGGYNTQGPGCCNPATEINEYNSTKDYLTLKTAVLPPPGRYAHSCAEDSATHKIYCFGGASTASGLYDTAIEYTPSTNFVYTYYGALPSPRSGLSCASHSATNKIYCFGGANASTWAAFDDILEVNSTSFPSLVKNATLPGPRQGLSCTNYRANNKIYCFGGRDQNNNLSEQIVEYDPITDSLTIKNATISSGFGTSCSETSANDKIYCFGGMNSTSISSNIYEYDPLKDTLLVLPTTMPTEITGHSCAQNSATGRIYCFAGNDNTGQGKDRVIEFVPDKFKWVQII